MEVGYPVNFTPQGDTTQEALTKTVGLEIPKIYRHLNELQSKAGQRGEFSRAAGIVDAVVDLPSTAALGALYYVRNSKQLYTYKTLEGWSPIDILRIPPATTTNSGSVELGTLAGAQSESPSLTKVIPASGVDMQVAGLPRGCVIMWQSAEIPEGWAECNGENGTPDLRNKFVRGAETEEQNQTTGGADNITVTATKMLAHTHTYNLAATSAAHSHTIVGTSDTKEDAHNHSETNYLYLNTVPGHTHGTYREILLMGTVIPIAIRNGTALFSEGTNNSPSPHANHTHTIDVGCTVANANENHSHTATGSSNSVQPPAVTINGATGGPSSLGTGYNHDTRPRHKHLTFIMKV